MLNFNSIKISFRVTIIPQKPIFMKTDIDLERILICYKSQSGRKDITQIKQSGHILGPLLSCSQT